MSKNYTDRPIFMGGTGGSGTRVFVKMLELAHVYMVPERGHDALDLAPMVGEYGGRGYHQSVVRGILQGNLPPLEGEYSLYTQQFREAVKKHRRNIPDYRQMWGAKFPGLFLILPYLHELYPDMLFVHIVRDGRDMCFPNTPGIHPASLWTHYELFGDAVLRPEHRELPHFEQVIKFWEIVNMGVNAYGHKMMPQQYICIRYEDIIYDPAVTITILWEFIKSGGEMQDALDAVAWKPENHRSIGRYKREVYKDVIDGVTEAGKQGLSYFRYLDYPYVDRIPPVP